MKRAALLLRCSTNIQDYNRQKLELEKVANRFKLKVAKVFGEHVTGKDDIRKGNRKSVDELINACENDEIDVVLISEVSRLTRNFLYGVTLVDKFNRDYSIPIYFRDKRKWTIDVPTHLIYIHRLGELYTFWCGAIVLSVPKGNARSPRNRIRQI